MKTELRKYHRFLINKQTAYFEKDAKIDEFIDEFLNSEASNESLSVRDNEESKEYFCELKLTWNNCSVWTKTRGSCDTSCKHYKQKI